MKLQELPRRCNHCDEEMWVSLDAVRYHNAECKHCGRDNDLSDYEIIRMLCDWVGELADG